MGGLVSLGSPVALPGKEAPGFGARRAAGLNLAVRTHYRFAPGLLVRSLGLALVGLGLLVAVASVLVVVLDLPSGVLTGVVVATVVAVVALGLALTRLSRLVQFDEDGYRVRMLRGAGVKQGRWREVEDAVTATVAGQDCVVLRRRDGRTTTIPVGVLDVDREAFMRDLTGRLDAGHGYRRLS